MRVSVITPSFNYGRFIEEAIASVLQQAPGLELELVISDGGSTDGTIEIVQKAADPHIMLISEPDDGQSDALNRALARSTGDVIGWMNADDYYLPGAFEAIAEVFVANPSVDVVSGDALFVDVNSRVLRLLGGYPVNDRVLERRGCVIPSCATFVRRTALQGWAFDTQLRVVMDWDYFLYLRRAGGDWAYIAKPLSAFRRHDDQVTAARADRRGMENQRVTDRYDLPPRTRASLLLGDWLHRWKKLSSGNYSREARVLGCRGQVVGWASGEPAIESLLDAYGRRLGEVTIVGSRGRKVGR